MGFVIDNPGVLTWGAAVPSDMAWADSYALGTSIGCVDVRGAQRVEVTLESTALNAIQFRILFNRAIVAQASVGNWTVLDGVIDPTNPEVIQSWIYTITSATTPRIGVAVPPRGQMMKVQVLDPTNTNVSVSVYMRVVK